MTVEVVAPDRVDEDRHERHVYQIKSILESSPSAFIFIAYEQGDRQEKTVVLKVLRAYEDTRYQQARANERLECQREALRKNPLITPDIYHGLGFILEPTLEEIEEKAFQSKLESITLGKMARNIDEFDSLYEIDRLYLYRGEYALVMSFLPEKQRLDHLLREEPSVNLIRYMELLAERVAQMHKSFLPLGTTPWDRFGNPWGSYLQLREKLQHNLTYLDFIGQENCERYQQCSTLRIAMQGFINHPDLQAAFEMRRAKFVKQCHGDLKASNIWIETMRQSGNLVSNVSILDAVDFNESYRNIDVLADLAMLVVDIEANEISYCETSYYEYDWHKGCDNQLATFVIKVYLSLTKQAEDDSAHRVLAYYLLEKAIVRAIVCLLYDRDEHQLGERFLDIAIEHAKYLGRLLEMPEIVERLCTKSLIEA